MTGMGVPVGASKRPRRARKESDETVSAFTDQCIAVLRKSAEPLVASQYGATVRIPNDDLDVWVQCLLEVVAEIQQDRATFRRREDCLSHLILSLARRNVLVCGYAPDAVVWGRKWFEMYGVHIKGGLEGQVIRDLQEQRYEIEQGGRGRPTRSLLLYLLWRIIGADHACPEQEVVPLISILLQENPDETHQDYADAYAQLNGDGFPILPLHPEVQTELLATIQAERERPAPIPNASEAPTPILAPSRERKPRGQSGPKKTRDREIVDSTLDAMLDLGKRLINYWNGGK